MKSDFQKYRFIHKPRRQATHCTWSNLSFQKYQILYKNVTSINACWGHDKNTLHLGSHKSDHKNALFKVHWKFCIEIPAYIHVSYLTLQKLGQNIYMVQKLVHWICREPFQYKDALLEIKDSRFKDRIVSQPSYVL